MFLSLAAAVFVFLFDLFVKNRVNARQKAGTLPASFFHDLFRLDRVENPGMILGFGRQKPRLVKLLPPAVLAAVSFLVIPELPKIPSLLPRLGYGLLLGGGLNNFYDHWKRGYVIDYISLPLPKIRHIYFNLSDFAIFTGTFLLCLFLV
ncbi:MAG: signal peptidase II [Lachnospiraceae bacterium]|nr:signal peptidase II [Lachnospiraceae bacterium]